MATEDDNARGALLDSEKLNEPRSSEPSRVAMSDLGGSGVMLPRKIFVSKMLNGAFWCILMDKISYLSIYLINNCNIPFIFKKGPLSFCAFSLKIGGAKGY